MGIYASKVDVHICPTLSLEALMCERILERERGRRAEKVPEAKRMHDQGRVKGKW